MRVELLLFRDGESWGLGSTVSKQVGDKYSGSQIPVTSLQTIF
jgi:hypothetical protein